MRNSHQVEWRRSRSEYQGQRDGGGTRSPVVGLSRIMTDQSMSSRRKRAELQPGFSCNRNRKSQIISFFKVAGRIPHNWPFGDRRLSLSSGGKQSFTDTNIVDEVAADGLWKHLNYGCCDAGL